MSISFFQTLVLVQKTNNDWWQIRKTDGTEGFCPANYLKEHEPKVVKKVVQKPVKIPEKVKVIKTVMKKEVVKSKPERASNLRRAPSGQLCLIFIPTSRRINQIFITQILKIGQ